MTSVTRGPARLSARLAPGMAFGATLTATLGWILAVVPSFGGTLLLAYGAFRGERRYVHVGAALTFFGVILGGFGADNVMLPLIGALLTISAWEIAINGDILGTQMGQDTSTRRAEVYHSAANFTIGLVGAGTAYGVYTFAWDGQPIASLLLLTIAMLLFMLTLRE